eukprot:14841329-Alexandrium_andersonii.AAC.1
MGLFGAESTGSPDRALSRFRIQVLRAADRHLSACKNPDAAFDAFAAVETELDPAYFAVEKR